MSLLNTTKRTVSGTKRSLHNFRAGWPGGFEQYSLGTDTGSRVEEFHPATDPNDNRAQLSPLGLREYWYPLVPDKSVDSKRPLGVRLLGEDLVVYRDAAGLVQAALDVCPHRGVRLSFGLCPFKGYLSCGYHGATFDGAGECVEFITEGPDSKMVGVPAMKLHKRPTRTVRDLVFVWMGAGAPVPIEEDLPPEFFEKKTVLKTSWLYWRCNWLVALENTNDAHNAGWVHRNSIRFRFTRYGGRPRTPQGSRVVVNDNKSIDATADAAWGKYYADKSGNVPLRLYYPRVKGYYPPHRWRLATAWLFDVFDKISQMHVKPYETPSDWVGQRIPGMVRNRHRGPWRSAMYTRWCIPVEQNMTRVLYLHTARPTTLLGRVWEWLNWPLLKFLVHFNFSDQDYDAMRTARYDMPEYLSSTDSVLVTMRETFARYQRRPDFAGTADAASSNGHNATNGNGQHPQESVAAGDAALTTSG